MAYVAIVNEVRGPANCIGFNFWTVVSPLIGYCSIQQPATHTKKTQHARKEQKNSPVPSTQEHHGIRLDYKARRGSKLEGGARSQLAARRGWIVPMIPSRDRDRARVSREERARSETVLQVREGALLTERCGLSLLREGREAPAGGDAGAGRRCLNPRLPRRR